MLVKGVGRTDVNVGGQVLKDVPLPLIDICLTQGPYRATRILCHTEKDRTVKETVFIVVKWCRVGVAVSRKFL